MYSKEYLPHRKRGKGSKPNKRETGEIRGRDADI